MVRQRSIQRGARWGSHRSDGNRLWWCAEHRADERHGCGAFQRSSRSERGEQSREARKGPGAAEQGRIRRRSGRGFGRLDTLCVQARALGQHGRREQPDVLADGKWPVRRFQSRGWTEWRVGDQSVAHQSAAYGSERRRASVPCPSGSSRSIRAQARQRTLLHHEHPLLAQQQLSEPRRWCAACEWRRGEIDRGGSSPPGWRRRYDDQYAQYTAR